MGLSAINHTGVWSYVINGNNPGLQHKLFGTPLQCFLFPPCYESAPSLKGGANTGIPK